MYNASPSAPQPQPMPYRAPIAPATFARNQLMQAMQQHPNYFYGANPLAHNAAGLINQWHQVSQQVYKANHPGNPVANLISQASQRAADMSGMQPGQQVAPAGAGGHPADMSPQDMLVQHLLGALGGGNFANNDPYGVPAYAQQQGVSGGRYA